MRTILLIFACKRPKYADTGEGGSKIGQILQMSFMDGPLHRLTTSNEAEAGPFQTNLFEKGAPEYYATLYYATLPRA